jgi:hypothetical protein
MGCRVHASGGTRHQNAANIDRRVDRGNTSASVVWAKHEHVHLVAPTHLPSSPAHLPSTPSQHAQNRLTRCLIVPFLSPFRSILPSSSFFCSLPTFTSPSQPIMSTTSPEKPSLTLPRSTPSPNHPASLKSKLTRSLRLLLCLREPAPAPPAVKGENRRESSFDATGPSLCAIEG